MLDLIAATVIALARQSPAPVAPDIACEQEDGNPDGTPCVWTHPDTGTEFYVDSSNYWINGEAPADTADLTWCPIDETWSRSFHPCPAA